MGERFDSVHARHAARISRLPPDVCTCEFCFCVLLAAFFAAKTSLSSLALWYVACTHICTTIHTCTASRSGADPLLSPHASVQPRQLPAASIHVSLTRQSQKNTQITQGYARAHKTRPDRIFVQRPLSRSQHRHNTSVGFLRPTLSTRRTSSSTSWVRCRQCPRGAQGRGAGGARGRAPSHAGRRKPP